MLNLCCAGEVLNQYALTTRVLNELLALNHQSPMDETAVKDLCQRTRRGFRRSDEKPYPYMGNCLDFQKNPAFLNEMIALGKRLMDEAEKATIPV
jgi:hypothetical protein